MPRATRVDVTTHTVGITRDLRAATAPARPDPPRPVDGLTFGVATMDRSPPHGGEMHADGDELLYLVAGRVRLHLEGDVEGEAAEVLELVPGDALIVPQGVWHRAEIVEPCTIVYLTPGPDNPVRPPA